MMRIVIFEFSKISLLKLQIYKIRWLETIYINRVKWLESNLIKFKLDASNLENLEETFLLQVSCDSKKAWLESICNATKFRASTLLSD